MSEAIQIVGDWRKAASAQTQSAEETEQAFMDQAYAAVQSKAAPIMRAPYRLGFEIVHKNDDNTRLVGIFVFRVNKDLFYAPVFFVNGSIKGTDLFYRHSAKAFVPCTERWLEYLISLSETTEGVGVPISERTNTRRQLNLQTITQPPEVMNSRKWASTEDVKALATAAWEQIKSASTTPFDIEPNILRTFITETGGFSAMKKIANTAEHDFDFANALFCGSKPENYMPDLAPYVKSATLPAVLTLRRELLANPLVKSASADELRKGYMFDDKREPKSVHDIVIETGEQRLQAVTAPGVYEVLMADGSFSECLCAYHHESMLPSKCCNPVGWSGTGEFSIPITIVETSTNKSKTLRYQQSAVMGRFKDNIDLKESDKLPDSGKWYRLYDANSQGFSDPVRVESVTKGDLGTHTVKYVKHYERGSQHTLTINPDYASCDCEAGIYGRCIRWVPIASMKDNDCGPGKSCEQADDSIQLGSAHTLNNFLYDQGYLRGALHKTASEYVLRLNTMEKNAPAYTFNKLATISALMVEGNMTEEDAEVLVKTAGENARAVFFYKPMDKVAYNLRFPQFPEFYDSMNSEFGVPEQPAPNQVMVQADKDTPYIEKQRVGDKQSFDAGDNIDTQTPISLYNNSKQRGVSSVFEHGVVGSLINTYDSVSMIDSYMPKMQAALDCTGRTLFLFYWKPEDFAQAFGADDQTQLENKLISNFKSFGDLVIDLLQKTKAHQEGSVSLT